MGLKEQIKTSTKGTLGELFVEDWKTTIYIRKISMGDQIAITRNNGKLPFEERVVEDGAGDKADVFTPAKFVLVGAANADGSRIWADDEIEDVLALSQEAIVQVGTKVAELNGLTVDAEEMAGNSGATPNASSPSDSA